MLAATTLKISFDEVCYHEIEKMFAGILAAALMVCAVSVPAFAAQDVEEENCLSSTYVVMNIP